MSSTPIITIDGPSGVGKGTVAQKLAQYLQWHLLDSGAIYRSLSWGILNNTKPSNQILNNPNDLINFLNNLPLEFKQGKYYWNNQDISNKIRNEKISLFTSKISTYSLIREKLLIIQHSFIQPPGLVADGRDMGTVVFVNAPYKVYLFATAEIRANRRYKQLQDNNEIANYSDILQSIQQRDKQDISRKHSPLKPADNALTVDNSALSVEQVVQYILKNFQL